MTGVFGRFATKAFAVLLAVVGLCLLAGGAYLVVLGGSPYYPLAGAAMVASAFFLWRGSPWGDRLFALTLLATLGWSLWETGGAPWSLLPRLLLPTLLGLGFFLARAGRASPSGAVAALCAAIFAAACFLPLASGQGNTRES